MDDAEFDALMARHIERQKARASLFEPREAAE